MSKNSKTKTLYSSNKNVDISSLITQGGGGKKNTSINGNVNTNNKKKIQKKKHKSNNDDDDVSLNGSEFGDSDQDDNDTELSDTDDDVEIDDKDNLEKDIDDDEDNLDKDNIDVDDDDDDKSEKSLVDDSDNDEKEEKDYIDNEETLKSKCYSKYARVDYDDLDFDELFGDDNFNPVKDVKLTKPILTKYEFVRLLTDRSKQLAQGAKPMLKNIEGLSSKEIAKLELKNKIIPLIIERPVPNSGVERWKLSELEIPEHLFTN